MRDRVGGGCKIREFNKKGQIYLPSLSPSFVLFFSPNKVGIFEESIYFLTLISSNNVQVSFYFPCSPWLDEIFCDFWTFWIGFGWNQFLTLVSAWSKPVGTSKTYWFQLKLWTINYDENLSSEDNRDLWI